MRIVIFGLTVSSSWGNGHATLWRALIKALGDLGHHIVFFERDVPYYANHRDLVSLEPHDLVLYPSWIDARERAEQELRGADVALVTSYCADARAAADLVLASTVGLRGFYDMDSPVTLERLERGDPVDYVPEHGFAGFDVVLSYAGGPTLDALRDRLGAERVAPLYGSVDPDVYHPGPSCEQFASALSHMGTYAADRRRALSALLLEPARRRPDLRFFLGGSMYPPDFAWQPNIYYRSHVPPPEHRDFYNSSQFTLNITRAAMARCGYCPSGRLFEAAACGTPLLTDEWAGLEEFFEPGRDLLVVRDTADVLEALRLTDAERAALARSARERTLEEHSAMQRARDFERICESVTGASATSS